MTTTNRPFWLRTPCPEWCAEPHNAEDHPDDRRHFSDQHAVELSQGPSSIWTDGTITGPALSAYLKQGIVETEPTIGFAYTDCDTFGATATLDEAEQLAHMLLAMVAQARGEHAEPEWCVPVIHGGAA